MMPARQPAPADQPAVTPRGGGFDQAQMRRANMGLILRRLREHGGRSRARLAAETGMSKATMSSLIADLADRGLVREGAPDRGGSVGRPGLTVAIDGHLVWGLGLEINVDHLALAAVDLAGDVVRESVVPLDVEHLDVETVLDQLARVLERAMRDLTRSGGTVVGLSIAAPGVIDIDTGTVRFAPNVGWRDVALADGLTRRLGLTAPPIQLENDAKLGAVGEYAKLGSDGVQDLLYLSGDVGVGAGIIAGGRLMRGWSGLSGEIGHLALDPGGHPCKCGRTGCWESVVGLGAFLRHAAPDGDEVHDLTRPLPERLATLRARAASGDRRTLAALTAIATSLGPGLSILVDVLNPQLIVLGGYFGYFGDYLIGPITATLEARRMAAGSGAIVTVSQLGLTSASRGGAHFSLGAVFEDPALIRPRVEA